VSRFLSSTLVLVVAAGCSGQAQPHGQEQPGATEIYQDFRRSRPLLPSLTLEGPDIDAVNKPEEEGLRIALPPTRRRTAPVGVATTAALAGDFEITGTYEILNADRPPGGNGVGVALNIASTGSLRNFAKVGRFLRANEGEAFVIESWGENQRDQYLLTCFPAQARKGRLRFAREGSILKFLAAEEGDADLRTLYWREFGTDDVALMRFVVNNSGSPAGVEAHLVDLRIRSGRTVPVQALNRSGSLAAALLLGLAIMLALGIGVSGWYYVRARRRAAITTTPSAAGDNAQI
jgi:hypothetical protein